MLCYVISRYVMLCYIICAYAKKDSTNMYNMKAILYVRYNNNNIYLYDE